MVCESGADGSGPHGQLDEAYYKAIERSKTGDGSKSAIFSKMGEARFDGIPGLHKHMTCLTTPGPNAYNVADSNLETKKQLKCSANFMVQSRPENVFKSGKKR